MTPRTDLVDRLRGALADQSVREVAMFGGRSFMVDDAILVSASASGDLLVRIDPERFEELVARPGAAVAQMGGRTMGPAWLTVAAEEIRSADSLRWWLDVALEENRRRAAG